MLCRRDLYKIDTLGTEGDLYRYDAMLFLYNLNCGLMYGMRKFKIPKVTPELWYMGYCFYN